MRQLALPTILLLSLTACGGPTAPEQSDNDGDGFRPPSDCDDDDALVHPGAVDFWNDGLDADCEEADLVYAADNLHVSFETFLPLHAWSLERCDANADGIDDLVLMRGQNGVWSVAILSGPFGAGGTSTFAPIATFDHPEVRNVECADVDGDGRDDLLVSSGSGDDPEAVAGVWLFSQPEGGFAGELDATGAEWAEVPDVVGDPTLAQDLSFEAVGDIDGDGKNEILLGELFLRDGAYSPSGEGGTGPQQRWRLDAAPLELTPLATLEPRFLTLLDLDGEPPVDAVAAQAPDGNVFLAPTFDGTGTPLVPHGRISPFPGSSATRSPIGGDFDGDGTRDLAVYSDAGITVYADVLGDLLARGTIGPRIPVPAAYGNGPVLVNVGDLDGDGADDLGYSGATGTANYDRRILSGRKATLAPEDLQAVTLLRLDGSTSVRGSILDGDFDGDGQPDFMVADDIGENGAGVLGFWLSSVGKAPLPGPPLPPAPPPIEPHACDFSEIAGSWEAEVVGTVLELSLEATAAGGDTIGQLYFGVPMDCSFELECVPTDGDHQVFSKLVSPFRGNCFEGFTHLDLEFDGELTSQYSVVQDGPLEQPITWERTL